MPPRTRARARNRFGELENIDCDYEHRFTEHEHDKEQEGSYFHPLLSRRDAGVGH